MSVFYHSTCPALPFTFLWQLLLETSLAPPYVSLFNLIVFTSNIFFQFSICPMKVYIIQIIIIIKSKV